VTDYIEQDYNFNFVCTGYPIFAWKGESEEDFWWCIEQCISNQGWTPNLVSFNCQNCPYSSSWCYHSYFLFYFCFFYEV